MVVEWFIWFDLDELIGPIVFVVVVFGLHKPVS